MTVDQASHDKMHELRRENKPFGTLDRVVEQRERKTKLVERSLYYFSSIFFVLFFIISLKV